MKLMKRAIPIVSVLALAGCKPEVTDLGPQEPPTFEREVKGGRFLANDAAGTDLAALVAASRTDVPLGTLTGADFEVLVHESDASLEYVSARQTVDGIPVEGTWLNYTIRGSRIEASSWKLYQGPSIDTVPAVTRLEAEETARGTLRLAQNDIAGADLVVRPMHGRLRLAWRVGVQGAWHKVYVLANGRDAGKAIVVDDRVAAAGHAKAWTASSGAPGGNDVVELLPLANLKINGSGVTAYSDNAYQYPASGSDEVHALGQAWAGYAWHARQGLMAAMGVDAGDMQARALFLPSLVSNAADIPSAVRETILRDDDDGDLSNHTPHWDVLHAAASQHALGWVFEGDLNPPAAIADFAAAEVKATSATLTWTATGDDGMTGQAAAYDLRASLDPITEATFPSSYQIATAQPLPAGSAQQLTISIAPETTIYFAIKAIDEQGNASPLSGSVQVTTPAAIGVWSEGAETGPGSWSATGLWHVTQRRAASGTSSFWYGQETTGNYDTGAANAGSLTSPVIDLAGVNGPLLAWSELIDVEAYEQYDVLSVTVTVVGDTAGTMTGTIPKDTGSTNGAFRNRMASLAGYEDRQVQLRFDFNTVDNLYNAYEGWFVDDVKILAESLDQPEPEPTPSGAAVLVINEVLADPPSGYDANGDGVYSFRDDEFVELVNAGTGSLDLSGAQLSDAIAVRHTFAAGTMLAPGEVLVVFGGGAPNLPGIRTLATSGLLLNNDGDTVRIHRADGELLAEMTYGANGGDNVSLVRTVEPDPSSAFVKHTVKVPGVVASAGRRSDGGAFVAGKLVLNEVLADPKSGYDANGDGVASATDDEFVELVNAGDSAIDLSGVTISDSLGVRVTLPEGMTLGAREALVVFGGGTPALSIPGVTAMKGAGRLNLNNDGDGVTIATAAGATLDSMSYGTDGGQDKSLVRATELDASAAWVQHPGLGGAFASPGRRADGSAL